MDECPNILSAPFDRQSNSDLTIAAGTIVTKLRDAGHDVYFAGGFVRDMIMGRVIHDIDIATSALPDQVLDLFPTSRAFGKSFGVVQVEANDFTFEVATFRRDMDYKDGRHPDSVEFTTAEEDAMRRDFTVNGLFYDPDSHTVIDYVSGLSDIKDKRICAIGNPRERFREDNLRILRAVRFASVLQFMIEEHTWQAITSDVSTLKTVSPERIRIELLRTFMESPDPAAALDLFRDSGVLQVVLPEVQKLIGVEQPPEFHPEGDVYKHTRLMLSEMKERTPQLIWSILLHDIAKPNTFRIGKDNKGEDRIQFRGHAELGATMAERIMKRFRCSNEEVAAVHVAVKNHMKFISVPQMRKSTLRRWVGSKYFPLELELHRIDCVASHGKLDHYNFLINYQKEMSEEPVLPTPLLSGNDLLALGIKAGPKMGKLLKAAYDAQLEGAFSNHEGALEWLKIHLEK